MNLKRFLMLLGLVRREKILYIGGERRHSRPRCRLRGIRPEYRRGV